MNTRIYTETAIDHFEASLDRPAPVFVPDPRPTRHDAELVVAGIEARAIVRAGLQHLTGASS